MITIRRAKIEDCELVWDIHIRAIKEICSSHYTQDEIHAWCKVLKPERYRRPIKSGTFLVAMDGEAIVGFGNFNRDSGEVEAVYVDPPYVGLGVGKKILQALETEATYKGLSFLHLSASLNAVPFYESAGYKSQKQTRYLLPFGMLVCVPMVKELSSAGLETPELTM